MPDNYIWTDLNGSVCTNLNGLNGEFCFPELIQCLDTDDDGVLQSCDKVYCDFKCEWEPSGEIPFIMGDKIMFQLQFRDLYNDNPKIPEFGWGDWVFAHFYDASNNEEIIGSEDLSTLFRGYVCHNGKNSFQVIEVDTAIVDDPPIVWPCTWYARFFAYKEVITGYEDAEETIPIYELEEIDCRQTHNYKEADECMETHTVEGLYDKFDCKGNWYGKTCENSFGDTFFQYSNKTRIEAGLIKRSPTVENDDGLVVITENYRFTTMSADSYSGVFLPNYLISWYLNIFAAKNVKIDEISNEISNFALTYEDQTENAAVVNFDWAVKCSNCFV